MRPAIQYVRYGVLWNIRTIYMFEALTICVHHELRLSCVKFISYDLIDFFGKNGGFCKNPP